ncbi:enoyl-CoA hydratase/isomerase family protein [Halobacteriovorax sp. HLS]|uniref:enoyl-CoA hydratase/isomerase family protein n=1 Tax=Halobacteriovorax sp. HLS TaxID=2234000 RepID=UPI000FD82C0A|nr:enoyl-CoA hydratase/isomerase family protein [Halobacteriovorax sp. HLS]
MSLFNYNTLSVSLNKNTRSILIELNRPELKNALNTEMIFELETLFTWLSTHIEIKSVYLTGKGDYFCKGLDSEELATWSDEKRQKNFDKVQKIIYSMFYLPQTIIADLKGGCSGLGVELSMGADIRIASKETQVHFDHLLNGIVPSCGGVGFTTALFGNAIARQWLLSSKKVNSSELLATQTIVEAYSEQSTYENYLQNISNQSDIARIQTKRSLLESIMPELDRTIKWEKRFSIAGMCTGDWRNIAKNSEGAKLTNVKEFATRLKREKAEQLSN